MRQKCDAKTWGIYTGKEHMGGKNYLLFCVYHQMRQSEYESESLFHVIANC